MKMIRIPAYLLLCFVLAGCNLPGAAPDLPGKSFSGSLQVWMDAPLEGTRLSLHAAVGVVCHGTDPDGISRLEFSVDGSPQEVQENPTAEQKLFTGNFTWQPEASGNFALGCRAQNSQGDWSGTAVVHVTVLSVEIITPALELISSPTFTPSPTASPTPTPTSTVTPAGFTFDHSTSTAAFQYRRDCLPNPNAVTITVRVTPSSGVAEVYLFYHLENQATGEKSPWNSGVSMKRIASGEYSRTILSVDIPNLELIYNGGNSGYFLYQFVAMDSAGSILARSPVYSDVVLSPCR